MRQDRTGLSRAVISNKPKQSHDSSYQRHESERCDRTNIIRQRHNSPTSGQGAAGASTTTGEQTGAASSAGTQQDGSSWSPSVRHDAHAAAEAEAVMRGTGQVKRAATDERTTIHDTNSDPRPIAILELQSRATRETAMRHAQRRGREDLPARRTITEKPRAIPRSDCRL